MSGSPIDLQVDLLREKLPAVLLDRIQLESGIDMAHIAVERDAVVELMRALRDTDSLAYAHCSSVTAVDRMPAEPRFRVVWHLRSHVNNTWVRVSALCQEESPSVPSVVAVWPGAAWHERETFDMFGIEFAGNPDLRRILLPEGYEGHPLRKEFPVEGIEPDRLYREWDASRGDDA